MNTGLEFIKKLRPLGCALVVICFIGFLMVCFSSGKSSALVDYTPPESGEYYSSHISELVEELNANVLPELPGVQACWAEEDRAVVEIQKKSFFEARNALLAHFDESLLELRQVD